MSFAATWMDLEIVIQSEKADGERQVSHDIIYMSNVKRIIPMNLLTKQKESQTENKLMSTKTERGWWRYKLGIWDQPIPTT